MADAADSKSADGDIVRVQVPSSAPLLHSIFIHLPHTSCKSLFYVLSYVVTCQKEWSRHGKVERT